MFPLRTERLTIRPMTLEDGPIVVAYRSDPEVAAMQDWPLPYLASDFTERWQRRVEKAPLDDLTVGTNLAVEVDGVLVGDVYASVDDGVAEVGWTLTRAAQGKGYAREAAAALVRLLVERFAVHRIHASLHPDNVASARVCEAIGMRFEALTRMSFPGRDGWEDDLHYAMLRDDWEAWVNRPRARPGEVRLVELGPDNAHVYGRLETHHSQRSLVSPVEKSYRDALFPEVIDGAPVVPWMRGVEADGVPVGFVMLADVTDHHPEPFLWRLLVDRMHQRRGIGDAILDLIVERLRAEGHRTLMVSWHEGPGSPRPFYLRRGFVPTGNVVDGETEARLTL